MMFATPLGLLALLAIPAIVAIHLFRRRFPPRPVAGLFLWEIARQKPEGGGRISRLPITASLILECLAALALALILAGARISSATVSPHLVVLLDDSASMAAVNAQGESARSRAVRRVLDEVDRLGSRALVSLVQSGVRPSVLAGPAVPAVEARRALEAWNPEAPHHSLALGLRLARELAGRSSRLMVITDVVPSPPPADGALWVSVGEPLANVAIIAADRTLDASAGRGTIALTLGNLSDAAARRRLTVSVGDKELLARALDLPPGVSSLTLPLPPGLPAVRVALESDALPRDNEVTLAEPRPRVVGVATQVSEGRGRQALLKALAAVSGVTQQADSPHLLFADASQLDRPPAHGAWRVGFGRAPASWLGKGDPDDFIGPFVLEKRHPLLLGVSLGGVVWSGAMPLGEGIRPVVSAGDRLLVGVPAAGRTGNEPAILFNLDLDRTNLIRSPDWPILISNLVEMRRQTLPGPERWNYRVGEWVRVRLGREPKGPLRFRCGPVERQLLASRKPNGEGGAASGELEFIAPTPGGLLQIVESPSDAAGEVVLFELGVNFLDESEANLRDRARGEAGAFADAAGLHAERGPASDPLFWLLLAIGGTALIANWCLLAPARGRA
jgi:hypothetical protein